LPARSGISRNPVTSGRSSHHTASRWSGDLDGSRQQKENVVNRGFVVALAGVAIVVAGMAGCSSTNKACSGAGCASQAKGTAKINLDGKDQSISGDITCVDAMGVRTLSVGDQSKGFVGATVQGSDLKTVSIYQNGTALTYPGMGADAKMTQDGNKYSMSGNLQGVDMSNPMAGPTKHPFTMEITCP
jgi:ipoprotein LpqH